MGKTQTTAKNKYNAKAYDRITVTVKKGTQAKWKAKAAEQGISLNAYICSAVEQKQDMPNIVAQVSDEIVNAEKTKDELMNEAVLSLAESCQKLLYALDIIVKANPYSDNTDGDYDEVIESPYRETIQGYLFDFLFAGTSNLNRYCNGFGLKIEPQSMLRMINREGELFKKEALNDNLKNFLVDFNRLMGLGEG